MNPRIFYTLIIVATLISCIERQPTATQPAAPVRTVPVNNTANTAAAPTPSGEFTFIQNPMRGLITNVGVTDSKAKQVMDIRLKYVNQMLNYKLPNGKFDLEKVSPIMADMDAELKQALGPQKFARYKKFTLWHNRELIKRK